MPLADAVITFYSAYANCQFENIASQRSLTLTIHVHGLFNALLAPLYAGSTVSNIIYVPVSDLWIFLFFSSLVYKFLVLLLFMQQVLYDRCSLVDIW